MRDYTCNGCGQRFTSVSDLAPRLLDVSEKETGIVEFLRYGYLVESYRVDEDMRYVIRCDHPSEALEALGKVSGKKSKAA